MIFAPRGSAAKYKLDLENGVQIQFPGAVAGEVAAIYRTSDYWTIPARVATGDVEWPTE